MKMIRVGVVGVGYWGPNLIRNFLKIPGVSVVFACDLSEKKLREIHTSYPFIRVTKDYSQVLKGDRVDAVALATPLRTHYILGKQALLAKKHVLIEKPMTRTSKEAKELISLASSNNCLLMVGHTYVYNKAVQQIKRHIQKNELGDIYYYDSTRINLGLIQQDTNVVWDLAVHDFSLLQFLFPDTPEFLQAFGASYVNRKHEEVAHIIIGYQTSLTAHINVSWLSPVKIRTVLVSGSKKMIVYNDLEPSEKVRLYDRSVSIAPSPTSEFLWMYRHGDILIPHIEQVEALHEELAHFIQCIRRKEKPITDGTQGLRVVKMLEATDRSLRSGNRVIL